MSSPDKATNPTSKRGNNQVGSAITTNAALGFCLELQKEIELTPLLEVCFRIFQQALKCRGLFYDNTALAVAVNFGTPVKKGVRYQLELEQEQLGNLSLLFAQERDEATDDAIEELLSLLVYPLRNALTYHRALSQAKKDPLTGCGNRAALSDAMRQELNLAHRNAQAFSIIIVDLDHFKSVNDNYGHLVGDQVLQELVRRIDASLRVSDSLFRYGGEEFVLLLRHTALDGAMILAERIRRQLWESPIEFHLMQLTVSLSAGVATYRDGDSDSQLLARADKALYQAKQTGRNRVEAESN